MSLYFKSDHTEAVIMLTMNLFAVTEVKEEEKVPEEEKMDTSK